MNEILSAHLETGKSTGNLSMVFDLFSIQSRYVAEAFRGGEGKINDDAFVERTDESAKAFGDPTSHAACNSRTV